jgi:Tfp pilus assembly protein PilN
MLLDEAEGIRPALDFLQPRKAEPRRKLGRPGLLAGGLVVAIVLSLAVWFWFGLASLDQEIDELTRKMALLDKQLKTSVVTDKEVAQIDEWAKTDVSWLGELEYLSQRFPPAADAQLMRLRFLPEKTGGRMELDGLARSAEALDQAEQNLRDTRHNVMGQGSHEEEKATRYRWRFGATVNVTPEENSPPIKTKPSGPLPASPASRSGTGGRP